MSDLTAKIQAAADGGQLLESSAKNLLALLAKTSSPIDEASIRELVDEGDWKEIDNRFFRTLAFGTGGLRGKTIGVLGLAFKPNTDDLREAPAIELVESLLAAGAAVRAFDPAATDQAATLYPSVEMCKDAYAVADGADALVLMTEWNQFRNLDLGRIRNALRQPIFVDGRNVYDPARMLSLGFVYEGMGRLPKKSAP
jgi:UDPglucose 6-dehydrogenase